MGFPFKSIRNIFGSKKKGETTEAPAPIPTPISAPEPQPQPNWLKRQAPPARGAKATLGLIKGQNWALNDLISAQNYEDWRARSTVVPVPEKKYSIQACAYAETKRYALGSHTEEALALILKTRDKAAELKTSQQLVRFGHEVDHGPGAPRLPKFKKFDDGTSMETVTEAVEDDGLTEVEEGSLEHLKTGKTDYEETHDHSYVPASSKFDYMFEGEVESEAGSSHGDPDEDTDSEPDELDDATSLASDVNSDTYSLNAEVDDAQPIRMVKKSKPYEVDLRGALAGQVSDSHNHDDGFSVTKPVTEEETQDMEMDSRSRQLSRSQGHTRSSSRKPSDRRRRGLETSSPAEVITEPRHPPPPPTPRPVYILPSEAKVGRAHYASPDGIRRLDYIKSYLCLPPELTPAQLILKLQTVYPNVASQAAQANPALLRAADELDFDGILGTEELPYPPPPDGNLKQLTAQHWHAQGVKMFLQDGSNLFFKVGRREQERIQRKYERMRRQTTFEEETRIRAKMEGRVFRYADDRREELKEISANRGKMDKKPRRMGWIPPRPSRLRVCIGVDEVDEEEEDREVASSSEEDATEEWWVEGEQEIEEECEVEGKEGDETEYNEGEDDGEEGAEVEYEEGEDDAPEECNDDDDEDDDEIGVPLYRVASHSSRGQV
ncbi:hypothetical protein DL546_003837 [Coniochaeta pulveracea]|uniref:Uncharacterized protein n=1 Tax=Coniochaeta pulveracea TaxID=177199 RepID=A0A420XYR0_9PEZI|nr:hypothetical protein DL546_003837 [Coniochaeta pulveracea]